MVQEQKKGKEKKKPITNYNNKICKKFGPLIRSI